MSYSICTCSMSCSICTCSMSCRISICTCSMSCSICTCSMSCSICTCSMSCSICTCSMSCSICTCSRYRCCCCCWLVLGQVPPLAVPGCMCDRSYIPLLSWPYQPLRELRQWQPLLQVRNVHSSATRWSPSSLILILILHSFTVCLCVCEVGTDSTQPPRHPPHCTAANEETVTGGSCLHCGSTLTHNIKVIPIPLTLYTEGPGGYIPYS